MVTRLLTYPAECLRLLYLAFFQPFTLRRTLRAIHPNLGINDNPFRLLRTHPNNSRLLRYANQVWWLSAIIPVLFTALSEIIISAESFDWISSIIFMSGWWIGLWFARRTELNPWFLAEIFLFYSLFFTLMYADIVPFDDLSILTISLILWTTIGISVSLAFGVLFGILSGVAIGAAGSIAIGLVSGFEGGIENTTVTSIINTIAIVIVVE